MCDLELERELNSGLLPTGCRVSLPLKRSFARFDRLYGAVERGTLEQAVAKMFSTLTPFLLVALVLLNIILLFRTRRVELPPVLSTEPLDAERHAAVLRAQEALEHRLREELGRTQLRNAEDSRALRRELMEALELNRTATEASLEKIRGLVDARLFALQQGNEKKLDEMRQTVDEKLQGTLEARLGASFKLVSERLESQLVVAGG